MSRTGASTPDLTNTAAAASSNACSLRCASARFCRAGLCWVGCSAPSSMLVIVSFPPSDNGLTNGTSFRIIIIGALLHFISILWRNTIMQYRTLGLTGITVSQMCLGAMMFGAFGNPDHDDAVRIIHKALDAGINFIDTADGYSAGESERIVGTALARWCRRP